MIVKAQVRDYGGPIRVYAWRLRGLTLNPLRSGVATDVEIDEADWRYLVRFRTADTRHEGLMFIFKLADFLEFADVPQWEQYLAEANEIEALLDDGA